MYEREIRKVRSEIEDARADLEELATEVMIRESCVCARTYVAGNIFVPFSSARASNSICAVHYFGRHCDES